MGANFYEGTMCQVHAKDAKIELKAQRGKDIQPFAPSVFPLRLQRETHFVS